MVPQEQKLPTAKLSKEELLLLVLVREDSRFKVGTLTSTGFWDLNQLSEKEHESSRSSVDNVVKLGLLSRA